MKKSTSVVVAILMAALTVLAAFTAFVGWGGDKTGSISHIKTGLDLSGGVSITYEADKANPTAEEAADTEYKLQQRVDHYSTEAQVYREGANRFNVEIPGVSNADQILAELGTPGSLYFIAQTDADGNQNYSYDSTQGKYVLSGKTLEDLIADGSVICEGSDVADAQGAVQNTSTSYEYVVDLTFTAEGAKKFADATEKAFAAGESIGIYYDGEFISVPRVQAVISDGRGVINGMDSIEEANSLASFIRIGGLTLTLNEIRSNVVGAQLGQEAIRTSLRGGAIGLGIVMIIMMIVYLVPGVIASVALVLYAALMMLLINAFELTLTLPGIAGIILSIGMAVDANVIIYSRIQEEISAGASVRSAINAGFHKALSAILDGNITTLIAAAVLGFLGSGTIKGFAMTLALGVVLSMFTALVISRIMVNCVYGLGVQDPKFWARPKKETHFHFVKNRMKFLIAAALVLVIGIGSMVMHGTKGERALNFSLDFLGGTATTVSFNEEFSLQELDDQVKPVVMEVTGDAAVSMQKVVNSSQVIIKTRTLNVEERQQLSDKLAENFGVARDQITAESISATVGAEMRRAAVIAVLVAVVLMLLYIFVRFKDIRFATSAVLALCHDVLITLMAYAILRVSVGNAFIAVMLTILGYSINSTIVIFDRIRENLPMLPKKGDLAALVDQSINQTLTRSIFTNLTTFASILMLYVLGVASIKEFTLPMMVGILAGALSSVFLTGPLWYWMRTRLGSDSAEYSRAEATLPAPALDANGEPAVPARQGKNPNVIRKKKKK